MVVTETQEKSNTWTIGLIIKAATDYLQKQEVESPRLNAEMLLGHCLNLSRVELYLKYNQPLNKRERSAYKQLLVKRASGEPLQYLLGKQSFRYLELDVEKGVFIPRLETEILVEQIISWVKRTYCSKQVNILDIGTGSGAIAISLAHELGHAHLWATDISAQALSVASKNAAKYGLSERISFLRGSLFKPLPKEIIFHVIVSNPPYIKEADLAKLPPEVKKEPHLALAAGVDGLKFYQAIASQFAAYLAEGGLIAFEVGQGQAELVGQMFTKKGCTYKIVNDLNGQERVVLIYASSCCKSA